MPTRLLSASADIVRTFNQSERRVFSRKDLAAILTENRERWRLAQTTNLKEFIEFLGKQNLRVHQLRSDHYSAITKYTWGDVSSFELGLWIRPNSYLSHGTAVFLHALTDQFPAVIYSNREQSEKPQALRSSLSQAGIDQAFKRAQRQSAYVYKEDRWRFMLLSGKQTNRLEVGSLLGPSSERLEATKLERTLIDIVVRPTYAGGVFEVRSAFERARERVSTNVLVATLKKLAYVYPYHQAIGFYMERAGYSGEALDLVARLGVDINFYLAHGIDAADLDQRWRLFHPKGF